VAEPKYDVAISFLSRDEPTAKELDDQLSGGLNVFFFPRKQEDLVGTDGMESMRLPFFDQSRVSVVLYREGWGKTQWTRVEETAIKDGCLEKGWERLFFIVLDDGKNLPTWLPKTHVRFKLSDYGIDQAVGANKMRVQEQGGTLTRDDAASNARVLQQKLDYQEDKRRFADMRWITEWVVPTVASILADVVARAKNIAEEHQWEIYTSADQRKCVISNGPVSVLASWTQEFANQLSTAALVVADFNGRVMGPGERGFPLVHPVELQRRRFLPELSQSRELCWIEETSPRRHYSHEDLADRIVRIFLELLDRQQKGEFPSEMDRFAASRRNEKQSGLRRRLATR
jgi:hypothetical protein